MKDALHVQCEHAFKGLLVVLRHRCTPRRARVVHEHVKVILARGQLVGESTTLVLTGQVRRERDARPVGTELVRERVAHVGFARRDVNLRAGVDEPARNHLANAATPARHEHDLALDVKE